ncbi:unnamed protein product [Polarella glacialis]|uniref:Peptidase S9 prolyl oligopeptidase catalytic domain-containing protein n=1 Tax=Polarella glacialis TaxID=89957 RepID=A0A813KDM5_POLGL|nr:unnamed protein product [Polarella glacialis]CAE8627764.1 unnamed protein product [Polarella glacialis]CAE8699757.1 unnamed protein product [Polarella glacialis]CAE8708168.1 unnamed protein product [Polarella glacialis]
MNLVLVWVNLFAFQLDLVNAVATVVSTTGLDVRHEMVTVMGRPAYIYRPNQTVMKRPSAGIFVLHGSEGVPSDMYGLGMEVAADANSFLVVYPDMASSRAGEWGYASDIPYFEALAHFLTKEPYRLDPERAFVCGHSAGGSMSLFLQNEMDVFASGAAVEAAVGHLESWNMSKSGHRSMVIWNHADPVLEEYAPTGGEPAYYNLTISTLRRHGTQTYSSRTPLPTSASVVSAEILTYLADNAPELQMLSWRSNPGTHKWPSTSWASFGATETLVSFFIGNAPDAEIGEEIVV